MNRGSLGLAARVSRVFLTGGASQGGGRCEVRWLRCGVVAYRQRGDV